MKKIIIILLMLFFALPVFAEYKPIPKKLSKQYNQEVTQYINTQYPVAVHEVEQVYQEAHKLYLTVLIDKRLYSQYYDSNFDTHIDSPEFNIYKKILLITKNYVNLSDNDIPATGYSGALYEFLEPYFRDNKIDTKKLYSLGALANMRQQQIEKEQQELYELNH